MQTYFPRILPSTASLTHFWLTSLVNSWMGKKVLSTENLAHELESKVCVWQDQTRGGGNKKSEP